MYKDLMDSIGFVKNYDEEIGSAESLPVIRRLAADAKAALVMEPAADGGALKTGRNSITIIRTRLTPTG